MTTPLSLLALGLPAPMLARVRDAAGPDAVIKTAESLTDPVSGEPVVHAVLIEAPSRSSHLVSWLDELKRLFPFAQVAFVGESGTLAQLRQTLILVGVLSEQWTFLSTDQPDRWAALLQEARTKAERRQSLKLASIMPATPPRAAVAQQQLQAPYLESILQHAREAILFLDLKGRVTYWNRAAEQLYGLTTPTTGWDLLERIAPEWQSEVERLIQEIVARREDFLVQLEHVACDGRRIPVEQSMAPVIDWRGQMVGLSLMVRDITERLAAEKAARLAIEHEIAQAYVEELQAANEELEMQANELQTKQAELETLANELQEHNARIEAEVASRTQELEAANEKLRQADRYKDDFLSVISHELRTPLNFITGFASILDDEVVGPLAPKQHEAIHRILGGADRMLVLVNNLLDMSRMAAGKFQLSMNETSYPPIVEEVVASLSTLAQEKDIRLVAEVRDPGPLMADDQRLIQILTNLVSNAIKFTPSGGTVKVRACRHEDAVLTEVVDTGLGIAQDDLPKLFQRFGQLDMSPTRPSGGTGLGLSISKALVESHGGRIGVRSEPGRGTTFWFTIPLEGAPQVPSSGSVNPQDTETSPKGLPPGLS